MLRAITAAPRLSFAVRRTMAVYSVATPATPAARIEQQLPKPLPNQQREQRAFAVRVGEGELSDEVLAVAFNRAYTPPVERKDAHRMEILKRSLTTDKQTPVELPQDEDVLRAVEQQTAAVNHGRLALLGGSLIRLTVTEYLYYKHPQLPAQAVNAAVERFMAPDTLAGIARRLGAKHAVTPTIDEAGEYDHVMEEALADAFQAVAGAVHHELGWKRARNFCRDFVLALFKQVDVADFIKLEHPKAMLIQLLNDAGLPAPEARLTAKTASTTAVPTAVVSIYSGDKLLATAAHFSVRKAEAEACRAALREHFGQAVATASLPTELDEYKPEEEIELISEVERKAFEQAVASTLSGKATGDAGAAGRGEDKPASE